METTSEDDMEEAERFVLVPVEHGVPEELVAPLLPDHTRRATTP